MKFNTAHKGFTLIELLVVIVVIAILATLAISNFGNVPAQGRDADRRNDMNQLNQQLALFGQDNGYYPADGMSVEADWVAAFDTSSSTNLNTELLSDPDDVVINNGGDYSYAALPSGCDNATTMCTDGFTLTAVLETETDDFVIEGNSIN